MRKFIFIFLNLLIIGFGVYKLVEKDERGVLIAGIAIVVLNGISAILNLVLPKKDKQQELILDEVKEINKKIDDVKKSNQIFINISFPLITFKTSKAKKQLLEQAFGYLKEFKYTEAISSLRECLTLTTDDKERINLLIYIGNTFFAQNKLDEALGTYKEALELSEKISYDSGKVMALGNLGMICHLKGDLGQVIKNCVKALEIQGETGDPLSRVSILNTLGIAYRDRGDLAIALKYLQEALKICESENHQLGQATVLGNLGIIYGMKGDLDHALSYHDEALQIDEKIPNLSGQINDLGNIGTVYLNKGDLERALQFYQKGLEMNEKIDNPLNKGNFLNNLGIVCKRLGDLENALEYFKQALKVYEKIGANQLVEIAAENIKETESEIQTLINQK